MDPEKIIAVLLDIYCRQEGIELEEFTLEEKKKTSEETA